MARGDSDELRLVLLCIHVDLDADIAFCLLLFETDLMKVNKRVKMCLWLKKISLLTIQKRTIACGYREIVAMTNERRWG